MRSHLVVTALLASSAVLQVACVSSKSAPDELKPSEHAVVPTGGPPASGATGEVGEQELPDYAHHDITTIPPSLVEVGGTFTIGGRGIESVSVELDGRELEVKVLSPEEVRVHIPADLEPAARARLVIWGDWKPEKLFDRDVVVRRPSPNAVKAP